MSNEASIRVVIQDLPASDHIFPGDFDVMYERGGGGHHLVSTQFFRNMIRAFQPRYHSIPCNVQLKNAIVTFIIFQIQVKGGRFLFRKGGMHPWTVLDFIVDIGVIRNEVASSLESSTYWKDGSPDDAAIVALFVESQFTLPDAPHPDPPHPDLSLELMDHDCDEESQFDHQHPDILAPCNIGGSSNTNEDFEATEPLAPQFTTLFDLRSAR